MAVAKSQVDIVDSQEEERGGFGFEIAMPQTVTLEETEQWFLEAERVVESKKEELGLDGWFLFHRRTRGELQGWFAQPRTSDVSPNEAAQIVKDALPTKPGMRLRVSGEREVGEQGDGQAAYAVVINGEDHELLEDVKRDLEDLLVQVDGVIGLKGRNEPAPNELRSGHRS